MNEPFHLNKIEVQRGRLSALHPFICVLPPPPSTNALFSQAGRRRIKSPAYTSWLENAGYRLKTAHPPAFQGQVWLSYILSDGCRMDLGNAEKAVSDLLVKHGVIKDDGPEYVREIRLAWGSNAGVRVEVRPFPFNERRAA